MAQEAPHLADDISRGVGLIHLRIRIQLQSIFRVVLVTTLGVIAAPTLTLWYGAEPHALSGAIWWKIAAILSDNNAGGHILHPLGDPRMWTADAIVGNTWFTTQATAIKHLFLVGLMYGFAAIPFLVVGVILVARMVGSRVRQPYQVRGSRLVADTALADILIRAGHASDLAIGQVPLIRDTETQHILIAGTTGAGKTQTIYRLLDIVRRRGDLAIVFDNSGSFLPVYYRPELGDQILNPLDRRSATWSPWAEIDDPTSSDAIAASTIPSLPGPNQVFADAARAIYSTALRLFEANPTRRVIDLYRQLIVATRTAKARLFAQTEIAKFYDPDAGRTAASVEFNAATYMRCLRFLKAGAGRGDFSVSAFVASADAGLGTPRRRPWLFLTCKNKHMAALRPLITSQLDAAMNAALSLRQNRQRRIWLFLDELDSLNQMPSLLPALREGRKYGVCVVAGLQDFSQIYEIWGQHKGETVLSLFNTKAIFRLNNPSSADLASKMLGQSERERTEESARYGADTKFESLNLGTRREVADLVLPTQISQLPDLCCYIKLPGDYPIARTRLPDPARTIRPEHHKDFEIGDLSDTVLAQLVRPPSAAADVPAAQEGESPGQTPSVPHIDPATGELKEPDLAPQDELTFAPTNDGTDYFL